jgi:GNAT superfamily N-acetyltransferase
VNTNEIVPIPNKKSEIKKFVKFSWKVYKDNPYWVPPLIADQVDYIHKGPYHDSGVIQPFFAYKQGEIVGRIIAHYDRRHNDFFKEKRGCVGFFECIDDTEVSRRLFATAEKWLADQGMKEMYGPLNFLMYDASGILIDNFEDMQVVECVFNPPYYEKLFLDYGFSKAIDWYAYRFYANQKCPAILYKIRDRVINNKEGIVFRNGNPKKYLEETFRLKEIFNKAWKGNWGHIPLTFRQFARFAEECKPIFKPELLIIAEHYGEIVGFALSIPDVNQALKSVNGRLFPFGIFKMLLSLRKINRTRFFLLGVLPEYRRKGLDIVFYVETLERNRKIGYLEADCSVIVETNKSMIEAIEHFGARRYKTFRHFSKPISI